MGIYDFFSWIKRVLGKFNNIFCGIIIVLFAYIINNIPRIWGEDVLLRIILTFLSSMWEGAKPRVIEYWLTKPYLFELAIFLIALFFLLLCVFIKSQPPKGIEIKWMDGSDVRIVIINNRGYKLTDCCLQIRRAKTKKDVGVLWCHFIPNLPLNCTFLENKEWEEDYLPEIDHADYQIFKVAEIINYRDVAKFTVWERKGESSCQELHFEKWVALDCKFMGTNPEKQVLEKNFELRLNVVGSQIKILKVWQ